MGFPVTHNSAAALFGLRYSLKLTLTEQIVQGHLRRGTRNVSAKTIDAIPSPTDPAVLAAVSVQEQAFHRHAGCNRLHTRDGSL
jgi:hypothetical protein